jgi:hypothetical protein
MHRNRPESIPYRDHSIQFSAGKAIKQDDVVSRYDVYEFDGPLVSGRANSLEDAKLYIDAAFDRLSSPES